MNTSSPLKSHYRVEGIIKKKRRDPTSIPNPHPMCAARYGLSQEPGCLRTADYGPYSWRGDPLCQDETFGAVPKIGMSVIR